MSSKFQEITQEQLTFLQLKLNWQDYRIRRNIALSGMALNILVHDTYPSVRQAVAFQGYGLDILVNDPDDDVKDIAKMIRKEQTYQKAKNITNDIFRQAGCL